MEEDDKGCPMISLGVSVSSGTGLPGLSRTKAVKRLRVCVFQAPEILQTRCHNFPGGVGTLKI